MTFRAGGGDWKNAEVENLVWSKKHGWKMQERKTWQAAIKLQILLNPELHSCATFSTPTFFTPAICCRVFHSGIISSGIFSAQSWSRYTFMQNFIKPSAAVHESNAESNTSTASAGSKNSKLCICRFARNGNHMQLTETIRWDTGKSNTVTNAT